MEALIVRNRLLQFLRGGIDRCNGFCPARNFLANFAGTDVIRFGVYVHEDRPPSAIPCTIRSCAVAECRCIFRPGVIRQAFLGLVNQLSAIKYFLLLTGGSPSTARFSITITIMTLNVCFQSCFYLVDTQPFFICL